MTLKFIKNWIFVVKTSKQKSSLTQRYKDVIMECCEIGKPLVVYGFYCMALYHSQTRCHLIFFYYNNCI